MSQIVDLKRMILELKHPDSIPGCIHEDIHITIEQVAKKFVPYIL